MVAYALRGVRSRERKGNEFLTTQIFNAATFVASATLAWGIFDPEILTLFGDTKLYLVMVSVAGLFYSFRQLYLLLEPPGRF